MTALDIIAKCKLVAIVRLDDLSIAKDLSCALIDGGIRAIEFTLTNADAVRYHFRDSPAGSQTPSPLAPAP